MTGDSWGGDFARWGVGGAAVLALHVAAGYWIVQAAERGDMAGIPEPVLIDLAPAPEAAPAPEEGGQEQVTEAEAAPESAPAEEPHEEPEPAFTPPEPQQLPPVEDFADLIPEPVVAPDFEPPPLTELPPITDFSELLPDSALLLAASERPVSRPVRREPEPQPQQTRREQPRQQPQPQTQPQQQQTQQRQQRPQQSQQSQQAQQQPRQGTQQRQRSGGGGGQPQGIANASPRQMASWQSKVQSRIASHMRRTRVPGARGGTVTVQVRITIAGNGAASARLAGSTGNAQVDAAVARRAASMPGMPAPPNRQAASFVLPIQIQLR
ncbi:TonB C-terminal domain-containing protein [Paracoccus albus]|uniref:TonB C-terminal domain-containing protein n=1 Tax=Paracoccus albus TaxID=3017784 RepID=UPI0022EFFC6C|nr:TonB C-terminal domain-containing protein [Paracoccus albus]WBU60937.1 TonB C-terminal domain-containing protein [Paracoccus albus]